MMCNCGLGVCASSLLLRQSGDLLSASAGMTLRSDGATKILKGSTMLTGAIPKEVMQAAATAARAQPFDPLKVLLQTGNHKMKDGTILCLAKKGDTKWVVIEDMNESLSNVRTGFSVCYCHLEGSSVLAFYPRTHSKGNGKDLVMRHMPPEICALAHVACFEMSKYGHTTRANVVYWNLYNRRSSGAYLLRTFAMLYSQIDSNVQLLCWCRPVLKD